MRKISSILIALLFVLILIGCGKTTFTVTFESNGGSAVQAIEEVIEGTVIDEPIAPTKSGFDFAGWFKESTLTNAWDFEEDIVTTDITLYAKWTDTLPTDQELVDAAYAWLNLGDLSNLTNSSARIIMPVSKDDVSISWQIDKPEYIAVNGLITQPSFEDGDQTVTLTATLTLGTVNRTKVFTATVVALPSVEETEPLIYETFEDYADGNIVTQSGLWGPVSGKSGNSEFTVVSTISGMSIPEESKALKIQALLELQIEAPIVHSYDLVVIEVDLMQTASSNGSSINIQSSSSSPVVGFGLDGAGLFYRTDNGSLITTPIEINTWYTLRVEINLANKTIEAFYYADGQLMSLTPGPVTYLGTTSLQSLFIRSGSSTTTTLREPAYITNIVANRIEALPRPEEVVKLGDVTGITPTINVELGTTFTPEVPMIYNFYGSQRLLIEDTEYTLVVTNPVDVNTVGDYVVSYVFTNVDNSSDIVTVTQDVTVYSPAEPNEITAVESTIVGYLEHMTTVTLTAVQPEGTLYYLLNNSATANAEEIKLGSSLEITSSSVVLTNLNAEDLSYIHFVIVNNGDSNIWSHELVNEVVIELSTREAFYAVLNPATEDPDSTLTYALVADLDFTGFTWTDSGRSFKGVFYGNSHTISNITINAVNGYGGIFARANGATIRDLIVDNANITTTARAGILVGRVENNATTIKNIVIMNSSVSGADSNGVGGLIGLVSKDTTIENIAIIDSTVTSVGQKNVGGVVGRVDGGALIASDIYVRGITVTSTVAGETTLDVGAGAFVGYVRDSVASVVTANRIVIIESDVNAIVGGALIGYIRFAGSATVQNAYVEVAFTNAAINAAGLVGRVNNETDKLAETTIFGSLTNAASHAQTQDLTHVAVPDGSAWWSTNLPGFIDHAFWTLDTNNIYALNLYLVSSKPFVEVTASYNITVDDEILQIRQDNVFTHEAPVVPGYNFTGWYMDELLTTPLTLGYVVTVPVTLYGKYETVPASTVSFTTGVDGLLVDNQLINYGELATAPVVADQMIESVMKEVTGWTLNDVAFDFSTPISEDINLVAVWTTKTYEVTFNGVDPVTISYGELVSIPTDPVNLFAELTFNVWTLNDVTYDFNTPVTADINLVATFNDPVGTISIDSVEEFYYMATHNYSYDFELSVDLDFTSFTWDSNGGNFTGTFDGQNHTLTGINMSVGDRAGIFTYFSGTFENVVIEDAVVVSTGRAGIIAGEIDAETAVVTNVHFVNVSVTGASDNGVGAIAGVIKDGAGGLTASVISVINSSFTNNNKNVGALVGYVRGSGATTITDVYIKNVTVLGQVDQVGGIAGYVRNPLSFSLSNVVMDGVTITQNGSGGYAASVVGRIDTSTVIDIQNLIVINDTITAVKYTNTIVGRYDTIAAASFTMTNVYSGTTVFNVPAVGQAALAIIDPLILDATWFGTNMPTITTPNWDLSSNIPKLTNSPSIS
ncbi:MAG: InlB B-repeat-containing protein [Acholeplasmataceae bacterium]|nr:InlB B-repeat-containing protein [Acholeplasmataceae bacterium]